MFPHERSLVQKMQGKPFALIGVNSDRDRDATKEEVKKEGITWRSFWAGGSGGPIPGQWALQGWPTIVIIDHKGVIRQRYLGNPGDAVLDREIDLLVKEAGSQTTS
jgi:hypothetical protein